MTWQRALVLGGGGLIGVAWEAGLCAGLFERGVDLRECDAFVGTSAGAINGARLAAGNWPPGPNEPPAPGAEGAAVDPARLDVAALGEIFQRWSKMERANAADARTIGALAHNLYRDAEAAWIHAITSIAGATSWPKKPLLINAVDVASGERMVFDARSAAQLGHAIAASAAVPGIFASVDIAGKRYMDGQVLSSTHADVLLRHASAELPREVIIAMPTNRHTAPTIGMLAEREAATEIEALKAAGCTVHFVTPGPEYSEQLGNNLMDPQRTPQAYAVGMEQGRALAVHL
jgi:NTE family protein